MILNFPKILSLKDKDFNTIKKEFFDVFLSTNKNAESKFNEILDIIKFSTLIDQNILGINDLTFLAFESFLKHEHDLIFFMENKKNNFIALFNIEIKNNIQLLRKQMKNHLIFFNKRLLNNNVMFFGVLYIPEKHVTKIYTLENDEMIEWDLSFNEIVSLLIKNNFIFNTNPELFLKKLDSNFKEKILLTIENKIELISNEVNLIKTIKEINKKNKIVIIDMNQDFEYITLPFYLFLNKFKNNSDLLIYNPDIKKEITKYFNDYPWITNLFFDLDDIKINSENEHKNIIVTDGEQLKLNEILQLCLIYKKIILFGTNTKTTSFKNDSILNLYKLNSDLIHLGIDSQYIEYNTSSNLVSNKHFDSLIRHLFLPDKISLDMNYNFINKTINLMNDYKQFMNSFYFSNKSLNSKYLVAYLNFDNPKFEDKLLFFKYSKNLDNKNIYIKNLNLYSQGLFNVDNLFLIINIELDKLKKNAYLLNDIIKICNKANKQLNILILDEKDYKNLNDKLKKIQKTSN